LPESESESGSGQEQFELSEELASLSSVSASKAFGVKQWMVQTLISDHKTFVMLFPYGNRFWARLSAQVYLEMEDFEWAAQTLKAVCERVAKGDPKSAGEK
jgi:hypothetical protein